MGGRTLALVLLCATLAACAEKLLPEGANIRVVQGTILVKDCQHLGTAMIQSKNPLPQQKEQSRRLLIRARNLAHELGADTVMPLPATLKDRQSFRFYNCGDKHVENQEKPAQKEQ